MNLPHIIHKLTDNIYICCRCGQHPQIISTVIHFNGRKRTVTKLIFAEPGETVLSTEQQFEKLGLVLPENGL